MIDIITDIDSSSDPLQDLVSTSIYSMDAMEGTNDLPQCALIEKN